MAVARGSSSVSRSVSREQQPWPDVEILHQLPCLLLRRHLQREVGERATVCPTGPSSSRGETLSEQSTPGIESQPRTVDVGARSAFARSTSPIGEPVQRLPSGTMRPSRRASAAPKQKCTPYPNAT